MKKIENIRDVKEKGVVFTQFLGMMDLIEHDFKLNKIKYLVRKLFLIIKKTLFFSTISRFLETNPFLLVKKRNIIYFLKKLTTRIQAFS